MERAAKAALSLCPSEGEKVFLMFDKIVLRFVEERMLCKGC